MDGIAIVGLSGRFPGARDVAQLWENLRRGVESITFFSDEELLAAGVPPEILRAPGYVKARAVLDDIDRFDAGLFGYSPREAELLDPQQRLFLECAWEALERAGHDPARFEGLIGVYAGGSLPSYLMFHLLSRPDVLAAAGETQVELANDKDYLATRTSYKLGLRGPSMTVQTACSTSLVAVHLACQDLLAYRCDMALAGGVTLRLPHRVGYMHQEGGVLSPDGRCRAFDAEARGIVPGSGVGLVVLRRLEDALADRDTILAVIKATAVNNDGSQKVGYTAASVQGQAEVIASAQALADVSPRSISYIEAHGTGTLMGDPIEIAALTQAFRAGTRDTGFCAIGSLKTNLGHLDTAAGVAGLIKATLALQHRELPPSLHFTKPNPAIPFSSSPFFVNATLRPWDAGEGPRRAGVSSFGIGGTNAHAILEEAPPPEPSGPSRTHQLLVLSARTPAALERATQALAEHLRASPEAPLADIAYTLQAGRAALQHRLAVVCRNAEEAARILTGGDPQRLMEGTPPELRLPVVFMFPGQGSQYVHMTRGLYEAEPGFKEPLDRCAELLRPHLGLDLRTLLFSPEGAREEAERRLGQTQLTQPALFAVEYALARLWMEWGIKPEALIGHSIGEYVAACLAGVFELEDALALVATRGKLMQELPAGSMLAIPMREEALRPLLPEGVDLAAINGPAQCVVSGPSEAIEALRGRLESQGHTCQRLRTSHAFHSAMMDPILETFVRRVSQVRLRAPSLPVVSNLTGKWLTAEQAMDPRYWARHLREPVRFAEGLRFVLEQGERMLLEVGPGRTLGSFARQQRSERGGQFIVSSVRHPEDTTEDSAFLLGALGRLHVAGVRVDWKAFSAREQRNRVSLPTYPFERERYWIEPGQAQPPTPAKETVRKSTPEEWLYAPSWRRMPLPPAKAGAFSRKCWLLLSEEGGLGARLATRLRETGQEVIQVIPGAGFASVGEDTWSVAPHLPESYEALLGALSAAGKAPDQVVHLLLQRAGGAPVEGREAHERGFLSLLALAKALAGRERARALRIAVVAERLCDINGEEVLAPERATVLGPCRVIPRELPHVRCQLIDVRLPSSGTTQEGRLVDQLLAELQAASTDGGVAYRGAHRWVQAHEPLRLPPVPGARPLREGGVYLITGGLGGIGLSLAEHLARSARAKLVLVGRSSLPPREEWAAWLSSHSGDEPGHARLRKLMELERLGAQVMTLTADVTDPAAIRGAVEQAKARFGALHGVIHAAGVPGGGIIALKTTAAAEAVLAPKVQGTLALAAALEGIPLDFLVLCSSLSAVLGEPGQIDYAAANAFLDTFAHHHTARTGIPTVAIGWDAWREVGMAWAASRGTAPTAALEGRPIDHPLFDRCIEERADRRVYLTRFSVRRHWVLSEHRIMGGAVLPGTTYLEMARAAFADRASEGQIELRDILFIAPLGVPDDEEREVHTVLEKQADGWRFVIRSRAGDGWQDHVTGRVLAVAPEPPRPHDIAAIARRCERQDVSVTAELLGQEQHMTYGPRWRNITRYQEGPLERLATLALSAELAGDLEKLALHPALVDVATALAMHHVGEGFYLPLSYKRIRVLGPLRPHAYSYLKYREPPEGKGAVVCDVVITDAEGTERVIFEEFTMVRTEAAQVFGGRLSAAPNARAHLAAGPVADGLLPKDGAEVLDRVLTYRAGPHVLVATRELDALLSQTAELAREALEGATAAPAPASTHARPLVRTEYVAPTDEIEEKVARAWQEALGLDRVGIHDDFFDLGGHSLLSIQLVSKLKSTFGLELPLARFLEHPTVAGIAGVIRSQLQPDPERAELERLLAEVEGMSQEEMVRALAQEQGTEPARPPVTPVIEPSMPRPAPGRPMQFSLFYFSSDEAAYPTDRYRLILDGARFADQRGFAAVWTPERHFHSFGGLYPNPSVLAAGLATMTERVQIRAGSVVLPLHHPVRVAEEWSVADNLSKGRIGVAFATGWHSRDFLFAPDKYADRRGALLSSLDSVRRLWRGESLPFPDGAGNLAEIRLLPRPVQAELPIWLTAARNPETFVLAGQLGVGVLTSLVDLSVDQVAERVALYREALARHGHPAESGHVTVMAHTYVDDTPARVRETVRGPLYQYLRSHGELGKALLQAGGPTLSAEDEEALLAMGMERYLNGRSLLGTPRACSEVVEQLRRAGVDEVACLIDFGVEHQAVMASLERLAELKEHHARAAL
jgi:natural product biosynthesis luciferase-like monooxygenase protein